MLTSEFKQRAEEHIPDIKFVETKDNELIGYSGAEMRCIISLDKQGEAAVLGNTPDMTWAHLISDFAETPVDRRDVDVDQLIEDIAVDLKDKLHQEESTKDLMVYGWVKDRWACIRFSLNSEVILEVIIGEDSLLIDARELSITKELYLIPFIQENLPPYIEDVQYYLPKRKEDL